jgi:hypothetical protein
MISPPWQERNTHPFRARYARFFAEAQAPVPAVSHREKKLTDNFITKNKEDCTENTQTGPEVIQSQMFFHVEYGKGDKNRQSDNFLEYFQLPQIHNLIADAIGRHLHAVFKEGNTPADDDSIYQGLVG